MKLSEIRVYPVKSLSGIFLDKASVNKLGIEKDRLLMLVDDAGNFITQRKFSSLALINTKINDDSIILSAPYFSDLTIDNLDFLTQKIDVTVWGDKCSAFVAQDRINQWFSKYLGISVQLVKYDMDTPRKSDPDYSRDGDVVSFADGFPLLLISQASLDDLNSRLDSAVTMTNFRPNIVIDETDAYAEDHWKKIKIGNIEFDLVKTCSRCILTTIDPNTGVKNKDGQPLKELSNYRKEGNKILFGMNLIPRNTGFIHLNDKVELIE